MRFLRLIPVAGALALQLVAASSSHAAVHAVNQVGSTFSPPAVTVTTGDTVQWHWSAGLHTVTSGVDLADPAAGQLFDAPLDTGHRLFSFVFTTVGDVPYFCRFHVDFGMTGVVHVLAPAAADAVTWGRVKALYD
jgi:plastocyanin